MLARFFFTKLGLTQWGKRYPPKWGMNLFAKGDSFAI